MTLIAGLEGATQNFVACDSLISEMLTGRVYLNAKAKSYVWPDDEGKPRLVVTAAGDVSAAQLAFRYIAVFPAKWAEADGDLAMNELMLEMKNDLIDEDAKEDNVSLELIIGNKYGVYHAEFGDCSVVSSPGSLVAGGIGGTYALGAFSALALDNTANRVRLSCEAVMPICIGVSGPVQVWTIERE